MSWEELGIARIDMTPDCYLPNITDWAWLAGIIEGEGNVSVCRHHGTSHTPHFYLRVSNCEMAMLEECMRITGVGRIAKRKRKINPEKHRDCHYWEVRKYDAARVLAMIYPYMITKRRQARNFMTLSLHIRRNNRRRLTEKVKRYRSKLVGETTDLNKRGNWAPCLP